MIGDALARVMRAGALPRLGAGFAVGRPVRIAGGGQDFGFTVSSDVEPGSPEVRMNAGLPPPLCKG